MSKDPNMSLGPTRPRERDDVFRALSKTRRRDILRALQRHREVTISELAKEIVAREDGGLNSDDISDAVTAVRVELYHHHVPMLVEGGLVHYAEERDAVTLSEVGTIATAYLDEALP